MPSKPVCADRVTYQRAFVKQYAFVTFASEKQRGHVRFTAQAPKPAQATNQCKSNVNETFTASTLKRIALNGGAQLSVRHTELMQGTESIVVSEEDSKTG